MKTINFWKLVCLTAILLPLVSGCSDSDSPSLSLSVNSQTDTEQLPYSSTTIKVNIESNLSWTLTSDVAWCKLSNEQGEGPATVAVTVSENTGREARTATLTVASTDGMLKQSITLKQQNVIPDESYQFKIPVIFHVLYQSQSNKNQYVKEGWMAELLGYVNDMYNKSGVKINAEFVLAETDPDGNLLEEPGVERTKIAYGSLSCTEFMGYSNTPGRWNHLMWDCDKYINVFVYTFSESSVLGISHFPYVIQPHSLEGLSVLAYEVPYTDIPWPQCVSINNTYIYDHYDTYSSLEIVATLAHELGHFLGLRHAFSEDDETGNTDVCIDSDFCADTPTYNKSEYDIWMTKYLQGIGGTITTAQYNELCMRKNCLIPGEEFRSTNIMDYAIGETNRFTQDQADRMNYVLLHSPFIPGPKIRTAEQQNPGSTRGVKNEYVLKTYQ